MTAVETTDTASRPPARAAMLALFAAGCALTVATAVLDFTETGRSQRTMIIVVHALCTLLPVGLGLFRLSRRRDDRFARMLIAVGLAWSVTTLAQSHDAVLYSIGRTGVWVVETMIVYLLLAFPDGHLTSRVDRRLFTASLLVTGLLYLPSALFAQFPAPAAWTNCDTSCPHNALLVTHGAEGFFDGVVRPLREVLTVLIFAGVAAVLIRRARRGPRVVTRVLVPVAVVATLRAVALGTYDVARGSGSNSEAMEAVGTVFLLSLALVTVSFAAGLLYRRLFVADALQRLTRRLKPHANAADLRTALADSLEDPTVEVVYWLSGDPGRWVDETGWPVKAPTASGRRAVTEVAADGRRIAAILHDVALSQDPALVQAAASYALAALENDRLIDQLRGSLDELSKSRARIVAVGDRERRRIERDLHDGAQQRLVAIRVRLGLVAEQLDSDSPASAEAIRELEGQVDDTIDEVRSFARGIYPPLLAERGLTEALRAAGRRAPVPTIVDAARAGRYPPEIEATVYFSCIEALQNAAKHAHGATGVSITLTENPDLRFDVSDDGSGFDPRHMHMGAGIVNIRDRLAAVGGELRVDSGHGRGTRITGVIPTGAPR